MDVLRSRCDFRFQSLARSAGLAPRPPPAARLKALVRERRCARQLLLGVRVRALPLLVLVPAVQRKEAEHERRARAAEAEREQRPRQRVEERLGLARIDALARRLALGRRRRLGRGRRGRERASRHPLAWEVAQR